MTTDKTPTPRTERFLMRVSPANGIYPTTFHGKDGYTFNPNGIVDADFARALELELRSLHADHERLKELARAVVDLWEDDEYLYEEVKNLRDAIKE